MGRKGAGRASEGASGTAAEALNAKQQAFVVEYARDGNATQAAIRAGYSRATARQAGSRLLTHPVVSDACKQAHQQAHAERIARVQEETGITLERTLREIAIGAFGEPSPELRHGEKAKYIDMLMKHLGGYRADNEQGAAEAMKGMSIALNFVGSAKA